MRVLLTCVILLTFVLEGLTFSILTGPMKNAVKNARQKRKVLHLSSIRNLFKDHEAGPFDKIMPMAGSGQKNLQQVSSEGPLLSRTASWLLSKVVRSQVHRITGLSISVKSKSNTDVMRGQFESINVTFDELHSDELDVSGGGNISVSNLHVDLNRLLFKSLQYVRKPYNVHLDLQMTQSDIAGSKFVKSLLRTLCNDALMRTFGVSDTINTNVTRINVVDDRIVVRGEVSGLLDSQITSWNLRGTPAENTTTGAGTDTGVGASTKSAITFEMSTALSMQTGSDRLLLLQALSVVMNPDHMLRTALPVPAIEVDLGDSCHIERLRVADNILRFTGDVLISPHAPLVLAVPATEPTWTDTLHPLSLLWAGWTTTLYRYDLSAIVSSSVNLNGGVVKNWFKKKFSFIL